MESVDRVAALQHLPPNQRAVLFLGEVLHWEVNDIAELLGTSVESVNRTLEQFQLHPADVSEAMSSSTPRGLTIGSHTRDER